MEEYTEKADSQSGDATSLNIRHRLWLNFGLVGETT